MTTLTTQLETQLRSLPDVAVREDVAPFEVDGLRPSLVVAPSSQDDVASILNASSEAGAAVVPWGAGSHMALGMPPERYDIALDLRRLNRVIEYTPADMTVTVEAGIALQDLQQRLGQNGQWLALDPPGAAPMTIGGLLAANVSGPARHSKGSMRDLLIGIRFVTAEGMTVNAGGRVVKNVAGYDLGKLQIGALGTLGVITKATFKIAPRPAHVAEEQALGVLEAVLRLRDAIEDLRLPVLSLMVRAVPGPGALWILNVRFAGGKAAVERSQREFETVAAAEKLQTLRVSHETWEDPVGAVYRNDVTLAVHASFTPTAAAAICTAFARTAKMVVCYPSVGVLDASWDTAPSSNLLLELRKHCTEAGGAMVVTRAPASLKRRIDVWGQTRGDFGLMRRVKDQLDPQRLLNPGRYLGGI